MFSKYFLRLSRPFNLLRSFSFFKQFIGPNKLFFDIGANVGNRTRIFTKLGVKVIAVEPQPDCANVLEKEFLGRDVILVRKGVGREMGVMKMSICDTENGLSTFSDKWKTGRFKDFKFDREISVPMTTLDELINQFGQPDFCKVDVEGFELEVFSGLTKKIGCVNFEFTSEFFDNAKKCIARLILIGFKEFNFTLGERPQFVLNSWKNQEELLVELNKRLKKNNDLWGDIYAR